MTNSSDSFFLSGPAPDPAYSNIRDHPRGVEDRAFCDALWSQYSSLADAHFRKDARSHFHERFWEMYLAVALIERGFDLRRHGGEGPDFFVPLAERRLWIEAVAPGSGSGPDRVPELMFGHPIAVEVPVEKMLLRYTSALAEKRMRYDAAVRKGIVSTDDAYLLAINSWEIRHVRDDDSVPYFVQAFLPFGPVTLEFDVTTFELTRTFRAERSAIRKMNETEISTRSFLDPESSFCSAVLHSAVDCANRTELMGGDFSVLHNPQARLPIDRAMFGWCTQLSLRQNVLHREDPEDPSRAAG